jgi:hypothetical protein
MRNKIIFVFLVCFCVSVIFTLVGIGILWFKPEVKDLPYLKWLFILTFAELSPVVIGIAKGDIRLRAEESGKIFNCKTQRQINDYLRNFIARGSRVDIFSGRLSWVAEDDEMKSFLIEKARSCEVNIFLPQMNDVARELQNNSINVHEYRDIEYAPRARFTLLNRERPGGEVIAISSGALPNHRIVEYEASNSPMLIAAASDLVAMVEKLRQ